MCEAMKADGTQCAKPYRFIVNGLLREVQTLACSQHLAKTVMELSTYDNPSVKRREGSAGGTVYVRREV